MNKQNPQGRNKEGNKGAVPLEVTSSGRGGGRFNRGGGNRNLPRSLGGVKNVMKGYCPPTSMGLPITLSPPYF